MATGAGAQRGKLKQHVRELVERHAPEAIDVARDILEHPETGFREERTAGLVKQWFTRLGLVYRDGLALTGVRADVSGAGDDGAESGTLRSSTVARSSGPEAGAARSQSRTATDGWRGPTVAVMGELDSLIVPGHPHADRNTHFAHACGHHAQIGTMLAVAAALADPDVRAHLRGNAALMAVPAEEFIELEYRQELAAEGKLEFMGGKAELVRLGFFDDVDICLLTHASSNTDEGLLAYESVNNGAVAKEARFIGVQAHAGSAPHRGVNALQAAALAMAAINANRETFQDQNSIRVHPIVTHGGDVVNAVPADVRMEMFVRGRSLEAISDAEHKVDRSLRAGALAMGAKVEIATFSAYLPLKNDHALSDLWRGNAEVAVGANNVTKAGPRGSSTDMGDLSHLMPTIQPYARGAVGTPHGADFVIQDYQIAVTAPAIATALSVVDLLSGDGEARRIIEGFTPHLTKDEYLALQRSLYRRELYEG